MSGANVDRVVGRILGDRYEIVSRIGSGASAEVFAATDLRLRRTVAVKQLRSDLSEDSRFRKLFRSEAQLAAQLSHPNVVTVFDWSDDADGDDGGAYIVTELLRGGSLRHVLDAGGTLTLPQAAFVGLQAAQGLAAAHDQGLVHRDIKPANLLFGHDGRIHIADFGIARAVAEAAWTEPEGVLIGTARYAAPEQATAGPVDGLVDVYSLTVCLIEALTGSVPLTRENALGTMILRQTEDIPVDESMGELAEPLARAGLADPAQRSTAAELLDGLLVACRRLPDPEPLGLLDMSDLVAPPSDGVASPEVASTGNGASWTPNVRFNEDGDLIIDGEESSLSLPADPEIDRFRPSDEEPLRAVPDRTVDGAATDGSPSDHTTDVYPTLSPHAARRAGWWAVALVVFALLAVGALTVGQLIGESRRPEVDTVSVGLPSYSVEDYIGLSVPAVEALIEPNGWTVTLSERYQDATEPGAVVDQIPEPGARLGRGGSIELVLSLGPELRLVPEMVGRRLQEVELDLERVKLVVGDVEERFDEAVEPGLVMEATIEGVSAQPGAEFRTGTVVDLVVSSGPSPREVPPLIGLTVDQARTALEGIDLTLATAGAFSETVPEGEIVSTSPAAGASVLRGATVTVTVSQGKPFVTVPDVTGQPVSAAIDELRAAGFEVVINGSIGSEVLATRPTAGESVRLGSQIEILSSTG